MRTHRLPPRIDRDYTVLIPGMMRWLVELGGSPDQPKVPTYVVEKWRADGTAYWWPDFTRRPGRGSMRIVMARRAFNPNHPKGPQNHLYVLAHELAHIASYIEHGMQHDHHGPKFMRHFKRLCPPSLWHLETLYKPRNAMYAGISRDAETNVQRAALRA